MADKNSRSPLRRIAVAVRGVVQGVGFRPFVYNAARSQGLAGWVLNEADLVRIEVQGAADAVTAFLETLERHPPAQAKIDSLEIDDLPYQDDQPATFEILKSDAAAAPRPTIPADLATCADCLAEISDPAERRYGYPFTNCTNCGPRWSIIEEPPYDRPRTSMKSFTMCDRCRTEYEDPADRRFHAQPIACPTCGPHLQLLDASGREIADRGDASELPSPFGSGAGGEGRCISEAAHAVLSGKILALKGLGGFQLIADATNIDAVASLRERNRRPDRPFALMMQSLEEVRQYCDVSEDEAQMLLSHQAPIMLLRRLRTNTTQDPRPKAQDHPAQAPGLNSSLPTAHCPLSTNIAPGNSYLGVMLPYTPLHHLLMAAVRRPIVCTSGNISEEPMAITLEDALRRLGHVADLFLTHDRPIVRPVDDSIVRFGPAGIQALRRARGFAPLPVTIRNANGRSILAVGGHLKNTVALCLASRDVPVPGHRAGRDISAPGSRNVGDKERMANDLPYSALGTQYLSSATDDGRPTTDEDRRGRGRLGSPVEFPRTSAISIPPPASKSFARRSRTSCSSTKPGRTRSFAICIPITPRRARQNGSPRGGTCRYCACSIITRTWRRA